MEERQGPDEGRPTDRALIDRALAGDRGAMDLLLERHVPFIFNASLKMFGNRDDAEDLTQEVLLRIVTSLNTFRGESAFTTWVYRIALNQFLKTRRRGMEIQVEDFSTYFAAIADVREDSDDDTAGAPEPVVEELRVRCTTGMLMCLDRSQRIIFILGAMFGLSHQVAAEALDITPGNFRIKLHRARKELKQWTDGRCGLVNPANPCHCRRKARGFVELGLVDPTQMIFTREHQKRIGELVHRDAKGVMKSYEELFDSVFNDHPAQVSQQSVVSRILTSDRIRAFFDLA